MCVYVCEYVYVCMYMNILGGMCLNRSTAASHALKSRV